MTLTEPPSFWAVRHFGEQSRLPASGLVQVAWDSEAAPPYNHRYPTGRPMSLEDLAALQAPTSPEPARSERGFWALIATQFQGAYSDNILRNLLLAMIVGMGLRNDQRDTFVSIITFLFSMPFVLFSMTGGWFADRFSKRQVTIWTKVMEIG